MTSYVLDPGHFNLLDYSNTTDRLVLPFLFQSSSIKMAKYTLYLFILSNLLALIAQTSASILAVKQESYSLVPRTPPLPLPRYSYVGCYNDGGGLVGDTNHILVRMSPVMIDGQYDQTDTCVNLCTTYAGSPYQYFGTQ